MDENQKENVGNDIKQETVNTFNEAKEKMKNIDFKAEAETGKGLLKKLFTNPLEAIKEITQDSENNFFKTAILLVAIWAIIAFVKQLLYYITSKYAKEYEYTNNHISLYENEIYVETYIKTKNLGKKVYVARRMADCLRMRLRKEYPLEKICIILLTIIILNPIDIKLCCIFIICKSFFCFIFLLSSNGIRFVSSIIFYLVLIYLHLSLYIFL